MPSQPRNQTFPPYWGCANKRNIAVERPSRSTPPAQFHAPPGRILRYEEHIVLWVYTLSLYLPNMKNVFRRKTLEVAISLDDYFSLWVWIHVCNNQSIILNCLVLGDSSAPFTSIQGDNWQSNSPPCNKQDPHNCRRLTPNTHARPHRVDSNIPVVIQEFPMPSPARPFPIRRG